MNKWTDYLKPIVVLLSICIAVGLLLSGINRMTKDKIAANEEEARNASYFAALPKADSFTETECDIEGVNAVLHADNNAGYVISAGSRGYGGIVTAVVAFSESGEITNVVMMCDTETPGMGSKAAEPEFVSNFISKPAEVMELSDIDAITGATITSKAALNAVDLAIEAFNGITGGGKS